MQPDPDSFYAAMETGNYSWARTILLEIQEADPELAKTLAADVGHYLLEH